MNLVILLTSPISHTSIFMVLCFWTWWKAKTPDDRRRADWFMIAASVSLFTNWVSLAAARSMGSYRPVKLDAYAFWADRFLGNPSFFIGRLVHGSPALLQLSMTGYDLLPAAVFAAFALTIWFRPRDSSRVGVALLLSIASLPICYCLLPACGPGYAFKSFPQLPSGPVPLAGMSIDGAPNCMPSGHFAGALICAWCLRHWWAGRWMGVLFVAVTFLATLGLGEHYAIDLLAAVPYTWFVLWMAKKIVSFDFRGEPPYSLPEPVQELASAAGVCAGGAVPLLKAMGYEG